VIDQQFHGQFDVFGAQLALTISHQVNQFAARHRFFPVTPTRILADTPCVGKLFIFIRFMDEFIGLHGGKKKAGISRPVMLEMD
tara:strand:- start:743 stop:994 length:252 start_codon:yes stop_codon:yes gene_type:complete